MGSKKKLIMSTRVSASVVISQSIDDIWAQLRDFTFPAKLISTVSKTEIQDGKSCDSVGAVREVTWENGQVEHHRLIALDDQHYRSCWELIFAEPAAEVTAKITRITETNETLVEWSGDFANDVTAELLKFEQTAYLEKLKEIRNGLANNNNN